LEVYREDPLLGQDVPILECRNVTLKEFNPARKVGLLLQEVSGNAPSTNQGATPTSKCLRE
jgi:hypothetical protein